MTRDEYFFISTFCMCADGFHNFCVVTDVIWNCELFLIVSMKLLTNSKILQVTLFSCSEAAILTPKVLTGTLLCLWIIIPEAASCTFMLIFHASNEGWTLQKIYQWQRGIHTETIMIRVSEQSLGFARVFIEASKIYKRTYFSSTMQSTYLKPSDAWT